MGYADRLPSYRNVGPQGVQSYTGHRSTLHYKTTRGDAVGLLARLKQFLTGADPAAEELERMELEQVRMLTEAQERGEKMREGTTALGPKVRRRYSFTGEVQAVGFRWTTTNLATSVGATGWVRNEYDGTVTAEIQGIPEQVDAVVEGLDRYYNSREWHDGFSVASVRDIDVVEGEFDFKPVY